LSLSKSILDLNSKILTSYLDEIFHISPGCLLHNFKEHFIDHRSLGVDGALPSLGDGGAFLNSSISCKNLICFWDDKDKIYYLLFQIKIEIFFPAFFLPFFPLFSKPESYLILPFNQLFALKRVQMYETFFIIQIIVQVFFDIFFTKVSIKRYMIVFKIFKKHKKSPSVS
jgi:hypothetical protein